MNLQLCRLKWLCKEQKESSNGLICVNIIQGESFVMVCTKSKDLIKVMVETLVQWSIIPVMALGHILGITSHEMPQH
jgi:hypothetical protein